MPNLPLLRVQEARVIGFGLTLSLVGCAAAFRSDTSGKGGGSIRVGVGSDTPRADAELDRGTPPEVGPPPAVELPAFTELHLENGLRVVMVERHDLPLVSLRLQVPGGTLGLGGGQAGLAALTADMLDEGTGSRSAVEIAEEIEHLGGTLRTTAGWDASYVELEVLRPRLESALEVFADVVMAPAFREADFERVRSQRLTRILQDLDDPRALADDAFAEVLYGSGHPYGLPLVGTRASLEGLDRQDAVGFWRSRYHAGNATLIVAGALTPEEVGRLLAPHLATWRSGVPPEEPEVAAMQPGETTIYVVDKPGAAQSEIRVGRIGAERMSEDLFPLTVLNTVLGGAFTSRLNTRIREEKGYSYGAFSSFAMRRFPGPFVAQSAVHTPVTDSAVVDFLREIRRMRDEAVPEEELARARSYVALRLPQRFETVRDLAGRVSESVLYGLPEDFWETYVDRLMAVTPAEVQEAARRRLDPDRLVIVVAGDRAAVGEPLRRLGIGPVVVLPAREPPGV